MEKIGRLWEPDSRELARAAQGGEAELEKIAAAYRASVSRIAAKFQVRGLETDDLIQEGMIGLLRAAQTYESGRGASFHTYAVRCALNRMLSVVRACSRKKQQPLNRSVSLEELGESGVSGRKEEADPQDWILQQETLHGLVTVIRNSLLPQERQLLSLYLQGWTYLQMAEKFQTSTKRIDRMLQRVKNKLGSTVAT